MHMYLRTLCVILIMPSKGIASISLSSVKVSSKQKVHSHCYREDSLMLTCLQKCCLRV